MNWNCLMDIDGAGWVGLVAAVVFMVVVAYETLKSKTRWGVVVYYKNGPSEETHGLTYADACRIIEINKVNTMIRKCNLVRYY